MRFDGFIGNDIAKNTISNMVDSGRFPHAVILEGPEGCGRGMFAGMIAASAVCSGGGEQPCGICTDCVKAAHAIHPDIEIVSGGTQSKSIRIDEIRRIREQACVMPNEASRKVFIIKNAGCMTQQAQNALLKVFEEPPLFTVFILTCGSLSELLPTITSRAVKITLTPLSKSEAIDAALRISPDFDRERLSAAADIWGGCVGKLIQLAQDDALNACRTTAEKIALALTEDKEFPLCASLGLLEKDKDRQSECFKILISIFTKACRIKSGVSGEQDRSSAAFRLSQAFSAARLLRFADICGEALNALENNTNNTLLLTNICASLRNAAVYGV